MPKTGLVVKGFTRLNQAKDPEFLEDSELASLYNMVLDSKAGVATKRGGWQPFNTNAVDSSGNANALFDTVDSAGTNYVLAGITTKLRKSSGGTGSWSDVKTGLTTGLKLRITPTREGEYLFNNGTDNTFVISGTDFGTVNDLYITRPTVTSTLVVNTLGGLLDAGKYRYALVYVTATGDVSQISIPFGDENITNGSDYNTLSSLPVSGDSRVVSKYLLRTKANGYILYYLATLPNSKTTYIDNSPDVELGDLQPFLADSKGTYSCIHRQRVFFGNVKGQTIKNYLSPLQSSYNPLSGTSGGSLTLLGTYKYRFYLVDKDGNKSDYIEYIRTLAGVTNAMAINPLPRFPDGEGYTLQVCRTTAGGTNFNDLTTFTTYQITYTDTLSDGDLGNNPGSTFTFTSQDYPTAVTFSELGEYYTYPLENILQVFPNRADEITGIFDDTDGVLVFKRNSIAKIYTSGSPENWRISKLVENIGATEPNAICKNESEYFFISNKQAFLFNGNSGIKNIGEIFKTTLGTITAYYDTCYMPYRGWYVVACMAGSTPYILVYDTKLGTWYTFSIQGTAVESILYKTVGSNAFNLISADNNYLQKYDVTTDSDLRNSITSQISTDFKTKTYDVQNGIGLARLRKFWVDYTKKASQTATFDIYDAINTGNFAEVSDSTSSGEKVTRYITDAMTENFGSLQTARKLYIQISGNGVNEIKGMELEYRNLRRGYAIGN